MLVFERDRLILFNDIKRCPLHPAHPDYHYWINTDNERLKLLALNRYLLILENILNQKGKVNGNNLPM